MTARSPRFLTLLALAALLLLPVRGEAENAVFVSSVAIQPGESFVLEVDMETDTELAGWNINFRWSSPSVWCDSAVVDSNNFDPLFAAGNPPIDYENSVVKIALIPEAFFSPRPEIFPGRYRAARLYFSSLADAESQIVLIDSAVIERSTGLEVSSFATWSGFSISPVFYPGLVTIGNPPPTEIVVEPALLSLSGYLDGDDPSTGLTITTAGGTDLDWTAEWVSSWLYVTPSIGKTPAFPTVSADLFGLDVGDYYDTIRIASSHAGNSPVPVPVFLRVDSARPPSADLGFELLQNRPNPFVTYHDPETSIRYILDEPQHVVINIYDALGRRVRNLISRHDNPGDYSVPWDGRDNQGRRVASGRYFYRMRTDRGAVTKRMIVIK